MNDSTEDRDELNGTLPRQTSVDPMATGDTMTSEPQQSRLLGSFLSRVFVSRKDDGVIYTDDLLMDRILHRVESEVKD